jgi:tRNA nucleotidyltransferase (CCA-adding enzyme)
LSVEVVVVGAARMRESPLRDAVLRYLRQHRHLEPAMDGAAILALGCADGPAVGEVLKALRRARIDGTVTDLTSERALAEQLVRESN